MSLNNNLSQPIFKFVNTKKPIFTGADERHLEFIHRPKIISGVFDMAIFQKPIGTSNVEIMKKTADRFDNHNFKTEKEIKQSIFGELLIIGQKISKKEELSNRDWHFVKDYYTKLINRDKSLNRKGIMVFCFLWDNFIYQLIKSIDLHAKDSIFDILLAIHLGFACNLDLTNEEIISINGEAPLEKAMNGRLVLPKSLFLKEI